MIESQSEAHLLLSVRKLNSCVPASRKLVERRVYDVLDNIVDVRPSQIGGKPVVDKCVSAIWRDTEAFLKRNKGKVLDSSSPYFSFRSKVASLFLLLNSLKVEPVDFARMLMGHHKLFCMSSSSVTEKFWGHADWLAGCGVMPAQFANAVVRWPNMLSYPVDSLHDSFCLSLAVTETPFFGLRNVKEPDFARRRDYLLMRRPMLMARGTPNNLVRLIYAEITKPNGHRTTDILRASKLDYERAVASALGHDPDKSAIEIPASLRPDLKGGEAEQRLGDTVRKVIEDIRRTPDAALPRQTPSLVATLLPDAALDSKEGRALLLGRLVLTNVLSHYGIDSSGPS